MAFGKTEEMKKIQREQKEQLSRVLAEERRIENEARIERERIYREEREHENWLTTPVGLAATAKENGEGFFEIELEVGTSKRDVTFGSKDFGRHTKRSFTGLLSSIEAVGWKLEHVGYYFLITGESSRDKFLASGQSVAVSGKTMGIYLFRNSGT
jgi:hypothetical protein